MSKNDKDDSVGGKAVVVNYDPAAGFHKLSKEEAEEARKAVPTADVEALGADALGKKADKQKGK